MSSLIGWGGYVICTPLYRQFFLLSSKNATFLRNNLRTIILNNYLEKNTKGLPIKNSKKSPSDSKLVTYSQNLTKQDDVQLNRPNNVLQNDKESKSTKKFSENLKIFAPLNFRSDPLTKMSTKHPSKNQDAEDEIECVEDTNESSSKTPTAKPPPPEPPKKPQKECICEDKKKPAKKRRKGKNPIVWLLIFLIKVIICGGVVYGSIAMGVWGSHDETTALRESIEKLLNPEDPKKPKKPKK